MNDMIKLKENKSWEIDGGPRFVLTLSPKTSKAQKRENSYNILSRLIGRGDVIIELNGSLVNLPPKQRNSHASEFIEGIKSLGIQFKCTKITSPSPNSLLNLFKKTTVEDQVVTAYIPNEMWSREEMKKLLSFYGAKYFVIKDESDGLEMLDKLQNMSEDEQANYFRLIAFDAMCLNAMGIFTKAYELSDINDMLQI